MAADADGVSRMLDLKLEKASQCDQIADLKLDGRCYKVEIGSLNITFIPISSDLGLLSIEFRGNLDFLSVSTGRMFFFGNASGGINPESVDGDISIRNLFCLEAGDGLRGYAWDGGTYISSDEAEEYCPIDKETK
ncbi:MAG: hypothetical protein HC869_16000 [Rhodospirillales bacterium]|nr:hypothetical protein [Rhodospirillales bacterium]